MSRQGAGKPEFRLRFDYPNLEIERIGATPRCIPLDTGDPAQELRGFAAEVARSGGRLTAVLPEAEVWRGRVAASEGAAVARDAAGAALGAPARDIAVTLGPIGADGLRPAAAARRQTLREARAFLRRAGLGRARVTGAGSFPGFAGPPAVPSFAPPAALDRVDARAAGACAAAATLALIAWLAPWSGEVAEPQQPAVLAAAPLVAPPAAPEAATPIAPTATALALVAPAPRPRPAPVAAAATPPRPALVPLGVATRNAPADLSPPAADLVTAAPAAAAQPRPRPGPSTAATPTPGPAAAAKDAGGPRPRPAVLAPEEDRAADASPAAIRPEGAPLPRPEAAVQVAALGPDVTRSDAAQPDVAAVRVGAPLPRPAAKPEAAPSTTRVAALASPAVTGLAAAASVAPPPRRVAPAPARPKAVAAAPAPVRAQPAPVRVAAAPKAVAKTQTIRVPQAAAAAPVRTAALAPQPTRAQPARAETRQPARVQRAPAQPARAQAQSRQPGLRGDALALVGIFGSPDARHALVQLPNGTTERVRAGDQVQGVQITAVAADGVHLRARGRDSVLRLPD